MNADAGRSDEEDKGPVPGMPEKTGVTGDPDWVWPQGAAGGCRRFRTQKSLGFLESYSASTALYSM